MNVRHVGNMVEYACERCACLLTAQRAPVEGERLCFRCSRGDSFRNPEETREAYEAALIGWLDLASRDLRRGRIDAVVPALEEALAFARRLRGAA